MMPKTKAKWWEYEVTKDDEPMARIYGLDNAVQVYCDLTGVSDGYMRHVLVDFPLDKLGHGRYTIRRVH